MNTLDVFFAYAFNPVEGYYTQQEIVGAIEAACASATAKTADFCFRPSFSLDAYGSNLKEHIEERIRRSGIIIVDISNNNPNALYEMGYAQALFLPIIVLKSKSSNADHPIPSDLRGLYFCSYDRPADLVTPISERLQALGMQGLHIPHLALEHARRVWTFSPEQPGIPINIIVADSATQSVFRDVSSLDHIYLDNLCDKDSLVELSMLFARLYPHAYIRRFNVQDYPRSVLNEHLVLVGGTGSDSEDNNTVAREFCQQLGLQLCYREDTMIFDGKEFSCVINKQGHLCLDHGFFGRFQNPWNNSYKVFLIQGIHTLGVLGAAKTFSLHPNALQNNALIDSTVPHDRSFKARFQITILQGEPRVPQLQAGDIIIRE